MKTILFCILACSLILVSCEKSLEEPVVKFSAFTIDQEGNVVDAAGVGESLTVAIGEEVHFKYQGTGEKFAIWTGDSVYNLSHNYEAYLASGKNVRLYNGTELKPGSELSDFKYSYSDPGAYNVYVIASNISPDGKELESTNAYLTIEVIDSEGIFTSFKSFSLKQLGATYGAMEFPAQIEPGNLTTEIPGGAVLSRALAVFEVAAGTKVYIGETEQVSGLTTNDFSEAVTYRLVSPNGESSEYELKIIRQDLITEALIYSYSIPSVSVTGTIDEEGKTIRLEIPYGVDPGKEYKAEFTHSKYARVRIGNRPQQSGITPNLFTDTLEYNVTAEDGATLSYYHVIPERGPGVEEVSVAGLIPEPEGQIDHNEKTIVFEVLEGTELESVVLDLVSYPVDAQITVIEENGQATNRDFINLSTTIDLREEVKIKIEDASGKSVEYNLNAVVL